MRTMRSNTARMHISIRSQEARSKDWCVPSTPHESLLLIVVPGTATKRRRTQDWDLPNDTIDHIDESRFAEDHIHNASLATTNPSASTSYGAIGNTSVPIITPPENHVRFQGELMSNANNTHTPISHSSIQPTEGSIIEATSLTRAIHPSHEISRPASRNGHENEDRMGKAKLQTLRNRMIFQACEFFDISIETYQFL
jgi:hypothetical protein